MNYVFTYNQIKRVLLSKGYQWLDDKKPMHLNIIGIRSNDPRSNKFDDNITVSYWDGKEFKCHTWRATTDPGHFWLQKPGNVKGTGILAAKQFLDCWTKDLHQGKYPALVQRGAKNPMTVIRDNNKDTILDFGAKIFETGYFGINLHRANPNFESLQIDKWSAGCQVLANPASFEKLMELVTTSLKYRSNSFSYTLLNIADVFPD